MDLHIEGEACRPDNIRCHGPHETAEERDARLLVASVELYSVLCAHDAERQVTLCRDELEGAFAQLLRQVSFLKCEATRQ